MLLVIGPGGARRARVARGVRARRARGGAARRLAVGAAWVGFGRRVLPLRQVLFVPLYLLWKIPLYLGLARGRKQAVWERTVRDGAAPTASERVPARRSHRGAVGLKVAYLVNQYPAVSHSFIRREIAALEARGAEVVSVLGAPAPERSGRSGGRRRGARHARLAGGRDARARGRVAVAPSRSRRCAGCGWRAAAVKLGRRSDRGVAAAPDLHGGGLPAAPLAARRAGGSRISTHTSARTRRRWRCSPACSADRRTASPSTGPTSSTNRSRCRWATRSRARARSSA